MKAILSWSGGKDSCYAAMHALKQGIQPTVLLNMMNENGRVSRSHGLTTSILAQQAQQIGVPLVGIPATWNAYESKYIQALQDIKQTYAVEAVVFGDIDLAPHREWEEKVCEQAQLQAVLPLWQHNRLTLVHAMLAEGMQCVIVSCNTLMGVDFLGKTLDTSVIEALVALGVDPCGENGEFHTVVVDCPLFAQPIQLPNYRKEVYQDYCFLVWEED